MLFKTRVEVTTNIEFVLAHCLRNIHFACTVKTTLMISCIVKIMGVLVVLLMIISVVIVVIVVDHCLLAGVWILMV